MTQGPSQFDAARVDRLWMVDPGTIRGVIYGPLPNKSNSKQIVMIPRKDIDPATISVPEVSSAVQSAVELWPEDLRATFEEYVREVRRRAVEVQAKRPLVIKSKEARSYEGQFEEACLANAATLGRLPDGAKLYFRAVVFQKNLLRDLDCELLPDLLQKNNLIGNDRAIWRKEYTRELDKQNPRVEFEIGVLEAPIARDLFEKTA